MSAGTRVLVSGVVLGQPVGGVRRHNVELLPRARERLRRDGGDLVLLEGKESVPAELAGPIETLHSRVPARPPWKRWAFEGPALERVLSHAKESGRAFDLVHVAHLPAPRTSTPYTLTIHDLRDLEPSAGARSPGTALRRALAPKIIADAVRGARLVITVSESVKAEIEHRFLPRRTVVVPNAADHLEVLARCPDASAPLLHVGHVEPRKNLELLLRALALDSGLPRLELAGAPKGTEQERLVQLARELGVEERVRFLGQVAESRLAELYAGAAAVVFPSLVEGFGIGVLEAQRAGAPLAISNIDALREVAGPDVPSFAPDSAADAVVAIRAALATPRAVLETRRSTTRRFSWEKSADALASAWCAAARDSACSATH